MKEILLKAPMYPSEDSEKIRIAIRNIFPDAELREEGGFITGRAQSLERFAEILRDSRIRDAARSQILRKKRGGKSVFWLNKQVAFVGKVNFVEKNIVLGAIEVSFSDDDLDREIDAIAPSTRSQREAVP